MLFAHAADYREYKVINIKRDCQDLSRHFSSFCKKIDVQVRAHVFSGSDSIAVWSFPAEFQETCSPNRIPESIVVRCFPFYKKGQAELLLLTRRKGRSKAVNSKRSKVLRTYEIVVSFLFRMYVVDEVIAEASSDVVNFRQISPMTEDLSRNAVE